MKGISLNGKPIDPENFDDENESKKPIDKEINDLRKEDAFHSLYRHVKQKVKDKKEKDGEVRKYTKKEIGFMNCKKPINKNSDLFNVIYILRTHKHPDFITKHFIEEHHNMNKSTIPVYLGMIYNALKDYGYIEREKVIHYINGKKVKLYGYKLTEEGKLFSPEVLTKMVMEYSNNKNKYYKNNKKQNTEEINNDKENEKSEDFEQQPEKENDETTINININLTISFS